MADRVASPEMCSTRSSAAGEGDPLLLGVDLDERLGPIADAAAGRVQDPAQADQILGVGQHPQVGQDVAHLFALVEPDAADDLVRQTEPDEDLFEHPGLGVGPVEHRHVGRLGLAGVAQRIDLLGDPAGLVVLVLGHEALDQLARAGIGPQVLRPAVGVAGDDGVGGVEDRLGRSIILFQQNGFRVRVVPLELVDVADGGAAEGIDGLVGVTDDAQLGRRDADVGQRLGQLPDQHVLGVVGVLILVHQHVFEATPIVLGHVRHRLQQPDRVHDQVVEVHRRGLGQPLLVALIDLGHRLVVAADRLLGELVRADQLVLEVRDLHRQRPGRVALRIQAELAGDQGQQPPGVVGVIDRE